ncbi:MAG: HD domain-containing protein [Nitrososphaerota archaeon]|nr:HD domain-containing protein [Nitrososphaerota archaeon]
MVVKSSNGMVRFFERAGRLKLEPRRGWVLKLGMKDPESVADHSYRVALLAMVYADLRGLDAAKVVKMALLHDLPEALVGDSVPGERTRTEKRRGEEAAMRRMLKDLPKDISRRYSSIWEEYEEGVSEEARLVKHVDKLELALQAREYRMADRGNDVSDFFASARKGLDDADILRMVEGLA